MNLPQALRRRPVLVGLGVAVAVAAVATTAAFGVDLSSEPAANRAAAPPATGTITRMTLVETEKVSATLGYGDPVPVTAHANATLTWLPAEGVTVSRGQTVYRVDDQPVVLLYGSLPVYRVLRTGVEGADVKQLERNLSALGYPGFTVDDSFSSSTASAVKAWQEDLGRDATGAVAPGQVVVAPGAIRVAGVKAAVGDAASGVVLAYTGTVRQVYIALDVSKQHLVKVGLPATVTLPDSSTVEGKVAKVGTVATSTGSGAQAATTIAVEVSIANQSALGSLDAAPVTVTLESDRRENVLTVPVAALVALAEGGYGVQVFDASGSHYVAVQTGLFANGRVEISGAGVAEGMVVGLPR